MTAYLTERPPTVRQWYEHRNRPLTGCTVLHTSESILDTIGPDTGAEAVAEFIRTRTTHGSYHDLVDSDTGILLVDYRHGAYHDGTGSNNWALSLSFACRTSDWRAMSPEKRRGFLWQGALRFAAQQQWRKQTGAPLTRLRYITKAQSDAGEPGFCCHGWRDPGRRTDPGVAAPNLFPFDEWLDICRAALAQHMPDHPDAGDDMPLNDADKEFFRAELRPIFDTLTPGIEGKKHHGDVWRKVTESHARIAGMETALRVMAEALNDGTLDVPALLAQIDATVRTAMASGIDVDITVGGQPGA